MKKNFIFLEIFISLIVLTGCQKENFQENTESNYLYSKRITVTNDGAEVEAIIQTNNEDLINTTLDIEPIYQMPKLNNITETVDVNENAIDELENNMADIKITYLMVRNNKDAIALSISTVLPENKEKSLIYGHTEEHTWTRGVNLVNFSGIGVQNITGKDVLACFKWRHEGGLWHQIFHKTLRTKGDYVYGQVYPDYYKLRLKIHYNSNYSYHVYYY